MSTTPTTTDLPTLHRPEAADVLRAIEKRSYCFLSTVSEAGRPHAAGVLYEFVDDTMWVNTTRSSRKARNVATNGHVGVVVPVRRVPIGGPPSAVQFQAAARLVDPDDRTILDLVERGDLGSITGHGELDLPDSCFIAIDLPRRLHTYGLGMSLRSLIADPLGAAGIVER